MLNTVSSFMIYFLACKGEKFMDTYMKQLMMFIKRIFTPRQPRQALVVPLMAIAKVERITPIPKEKRKLYNM